MTSRIQKNYRLERGGGSEAELGCGNCTVGQFAIYEPTHRASPEEFPRLRTQVTKFQPGRSILREGEVSNLFGTLRSGWACRYKNFGDGRRQVLGFLIPGDPVTMEKLWIGARSLPYSVGAITSSIVCWFPLEKMIHLTQRPNSQAQYAQNLAHRYFWAGAERMAALGGQSAHARTALLLMQLVTRLKERKMNDDHNYEFPLTQSYVADALGVTTVHINRVLRDLTKRGVLKISEKKMSVVDEAALRRIFEEE